MAVIGVLLAAGRSRRFGMADKMAAPIFGVPMLTHAAKAMMQARIAEAIAVLRHPDQARLLPRDWRGSWVTTEGQMADSLRCGINEAARRNASHALIALGDMPFVSAAHLNKVIETASDNLPACSTQGEHAMVPACFPKSYFNDLQELQGDQGASKLLRSLPRSQQVNAREQELADIDTQEGWQRVPSSSHFQLGC